MENKKTSFLKKVIMAIKDFDEYKDFAIENIGKVFKYFIKLMILFTVIVSIGLTVKINNWINEGTEYVRNNMSDFKIVDGKLEIEGPIIIENESSPLNIVIINTTEDEDEINRNIEIIKSYGTGALFLKEKVLLKSTISDVGLSDVWYFYRDLGLADITKAEILEKFIMQNTIYILLGVFAFSLIYVFIGFFILALIDVMLLAILGYISSRIFRIPLKFGPIFNLAIYSMTFPILLSAIYRLILSTTGFEIKYFTIMYNTISYVYMLTAILLIKSDLIKRNVELTAIIEEQQKVKEEMERQRQEEELESHRREKEKEKKKNDGKTEDKKEGKDKKGESPEGSKA